MTATSGAFKKTIDWYENNAEIYAERIESSPEILLINRFARMLKKGDAVLDAGCAGGRDCRIFKEKGLNPTGLDITKSLIKQAKIKSPEIEFVQGSFLELPFLNDHFDGLWAHASLVHLEKISEAKQSLHEFHRVLKPGGIIHISVKQQLGDKKTEYVSHDYSGEFKRFFRFFTKQEIKSLLENTGFRIVEIQDNYVSPDGRKEIKWIVVFAKKI
ncbi:MAG: class I SAM-dependent methyltransferase [Candidatus Paceibacterota bacterium]|jgi:ubiquinone/menaquinone biosynthesis C-methylase UbiE